MPSVNEIVESNRCLGCGLCLGLDTSESRKEMVPDTNGFLVPRGMIVYDHRRLAKLCPGVSQSVQTHMSDVIWGTVELSREAWAKDTQIRHKGSSGGVVTALALELLQSNEVDGVLHVVPSRDDPLRNELSLSTTIGELLEGASSRYAPAVSFPEWFWGLLKSGKRYVYIGKPCDVGAIKNLQKENPEWTRAIPWTIAIFCAGMPSQLGTVSLIKKLGLHGNATSIRYRGDGWPGNFTASNEAGEKVQTTYSDSWGTTLNRYLHTRCKVCPDGIGLHADFAVGDAWESESGYPDFTEREGKSLLLARSKLARTFIETRGACSTLTFGVHVPLKKIGLMQPYQKNRRAAILFRLAGWVMARRPTPKFKGFRLLAAATNMPFIDGLRQMYGSWLRIKRRLE